MLFARFIDRSPMSHLGYDFGCEFPSPSPLRIKMSSSVQQENVPQCNHPNSPFAVAPTNSQPQQPHQAKRKRVSKAGKSRKRADVLKNNRITEYFPVRRSERKSKRAVLEEKQRDLENKVCCGIEDGLEVRQFIGKGRGVVTTRNFTRGEYVVEYVGELINLTEAKKREANYSNDEKAGCYMYYFNHKNKHYCIDATPETNKFGRLVNHSRSGNLITKVVEVGNVPHLVLIAKEDIPAGKEITYDYGDRSKESIENYPWLAS